MKRWLVMVGAALVVLAFAAWWFSPGRQLMRRTEALLRLLEIRGGRGAGVLDQRAFGAMLEEQVTLDATVIGRGVHELSRDEWQVAYRYLSSGARSSQFRIVGVDGIDAADGVGVVRMQVDAFIEMDGQRLIEGVHPLRFTWRRDNTSWKLQQLVVGGGG